jgi:hypothetical protein
MEEGEQMEYRETWFLSCDMCWDPDGGYMATEVCKGCEFSYEVQKKAKGLFMKYDQKRCEACLRKIKMCRECPLTGMMTEEEKEKNESMWLAMDEDGNRYDMLFVEHVMPNELEDVLIQMDNILERQGLELLVSWSYCDVSPWISISKRTEKTEEGGGQTNEGIS